MFYRQGLKVKQLVYCIYNVLQYITMGKEGLIFIQREVDQFSNINKSAKQQQQNASPQDVTLSNTHLPLGFEPQKAPRLKRNIFYISNNINKQLRDIVILIRIVGMEINGDERVRMGHSQQRKMKIRCRWLLWIYFIYLWRMAPLRQRKVSMWGKIGLLLQSCISFYKESAEKLLSVVRYFDSSTILKRKCLFTSQMEKFQGMKNLPQVLKYWKMAFISFSPRI